MAKVTRALKALLLSLTLALGGVAVPSSAEAATADTQAPTVTLDETRGNNKNVVLHGAAFERQSGLFKIEVLVFPVSDDRLIKPVAVFHPRPRNGGFTITKAAADLAPGEYLVVVSAVDNEFNVGSAGPRYFTVGS